MPTTISKSPELSKSQNCSEEFSMKYDLNNFTTAEVLSTDAMVHPLSSWEVHAFVDSRMEAGKKGPRHGWAMSEILEEVRERVGVHAVSEARRYIVEDICKRSS